MRALKTVDGGRELAGGQTHGGFEHVLGQTDFAALPAALRVVPVVIDAGGQRDAVKPAEVGEKVDAALQRRKTSVGVGVELGQGDIRAGRKVRRLIEGGRVDHRGLGEADIAPCSAFRRGCRNEGQRQGIEGQREGVADKVRHIDLSLCRDPA